MTPTRVPVAPDAVRVWRGFRHPFSRKDGSVDEIALVFYETQQAYHDAKLTVGGRAYSDLHALVFDLDRSTSGFPVKFTGDIEPDLRYHLFDDRIDWQHGAASVFVGMRIDTDPQAFMDGLGDWLSTLQASGGPDGAVAVVARDHVVYWEHWPDEDAAADSRAAELGALAAPVYHEPFARVPLAEGLWAEYGGVAVEGGESYDFRFDRRAAVD